VIAALLVLAALQAPPARGATVRGTVLDGATGGPVASASVGTRGAEPVLTDALGRFVVASAGGDTLLVRRVGYRPALAAPAGAAEILVRLVPVAVPLGRVTVVARDEADAGRMQAAVAVRELREAGVRSSAQAASRLPFVAARGTHGDVRLSMRGSRAEQVLVTLDGVPLNDPAVGSADFADLPLAALGGIAVLPGANPLGGPGASGGTLALTSGDGTVLSASGGAFGRYEAEGAVRVPVAGGRVRLGAAAGGARNDFRFVNTADARLTPDTAERRVNNDERRRAVFASAVLPRVQLLALASEVERGLVGGMNVRTYDHDRGHTGRLLLRAASDFRGTSVSASARGLATRYRDQLHPESDADARSASVDVEGSRALGPVQLRAGGGADRLRASGAAPIDGAVRRRAFVSAGAGARRGVARATAGVRLDGIERAGVRPSASVAAELGDARVLFARVSQAFRAPSLYDLYFASPQRLLPAAVRPERVTLDAELGARLTSARGAVAASVFERRTRDAIVWFPGNFVFSPANVPRERARGAEARAEVRGAWWEAAAWAGAYGTRLDAEPLVLPTPYAPRAAGGGAATARRGPAALTTTLRAFGRRPFRAAPASRRNELPGLALVDVSAGWEADARGARVLVTAGVENVGGVRWESVRSYPSAGRAWSVGVTVEPR